MSLGNGYNISTTDSIISFFFLGFFLVCLILTTVAGNILVIVAVLVFRNLRSITNFFIVSLACADLLVGCVVMPFAAYSELSAGFWPFGFIWCDLWHAFDVLSSTASILNLCMIAVERFWATENPITYGSRMSKRRCLIMIGIVWFCSSMISFPAIVWWHAMEQYHFSNLNITDSAPQSCVFPNDKAYIIISSTISFYIPLIIMIVVYVRIYKTATTVMKTLTTGTKIVYKNSKSGEVMRLGIHRGGMLNSRNETSSENSVYRHKVLAGKEKSKSFLCFHFSIQKQIKVAKGLNVSLNRRFSPIHMISNSDPSSFSSPSFQMCNTDTPETSFKNKTKRKSRRKYYKKTVSISFGKKFTKFATEQKAAKTLGIVMGIFIICWLPFFICNVLSSIYDKAFGDSKPFVMTTVSWLGYLNSAINPMIYAHSMKDFRRAFITIICSLCSRRRRQHGLCHIDVSRSIITHSTSIMGRIRHVGAK